MSLTFYIVLSVCLLVNVRPLAAEGCQDLEVKHTVYSSQDALMSSSAVFIVEADVKCVGTRNINLFAELHGVVYPVARDTETDKYQVTFTGEHKKLSSGSYTFRFFDEDGYAAFRKAQRAGEGTEGLKPLFTVDYHHGGVWHGQWVHSETIAILISAMICFAAFTSRNKILM